MRKSQKSEPFDTPERSTIQGTTHDQIAAMEQSNGDDAWIAAGMSLLILRTVGRRSGKERKAALPLWLDDEGRPIVVASYSGAPRHPGWFSNLQDRGANPEVYVCTQEREYWSEPEILSGEEYTAVWRALTDDRPFYLDYQTLTKRRIPLIRLSEKRPA